VSGALVVGAETAVGAALAARLLRVDGRAAALCATAEGAAPLRARGVEVFVGDAGDPEVVTAALLGRAALYVALADPPPPPPPPPPSPRALWGWRGAQGAAGALARGLAGALGGARPQGAPRLPAARPTPPPEAPRPVRVARAALEAAARLRAAGVAPRATLLCGPLALAAAPAGDPRPLDAASPLCADGPGAALAAALTLAERALWTTVVHGVPYPDHVAAPPPPAAGAASLVPLEDLVTGLLLLRAHDRALDPTGAAGSGRWVLGGHNISAPGGAAGGASRPLSSRRAAERLGYSWRPAGG